ncbi:MAG: NUDIX hydrolase [Syntrophomonadaceae bacterium]|nr:NUDIX hydrolase [Syntrophomonadaceae bacterium]
MDLKEVTKDSKEIFKGRILRLRVDTVELPDGSQGTREIVEHNGAVAIIALDDEGRLKMVRQYRKAAEMIMLEIPAGTLETGEDPLDCARRELEEETGLKARHWEKILSYYSAPGFCNEVLHLYLARDLYPGEKNPDEDEFLELVDITLEQAYHMIFQGQICDGKSIIGIQYAYYRMERT